MEEKPLTEWRTHLFDCFEDISTCCYGFWCCPCLACTVSGRFGEAYCLPLCDLCATSLLTISCAPACIPPAALSLRTALRNKAGIKGSILKDIVVTCCCTWCAWCQIHRELKHRFKIPIVINLQTQNIVNMQPAPMMMMAGNLPQAAFATQPGVVMGNQSGVVMGNQPQVVMANQPGVVMTNQPGVVMTNQPGVFMTSQSKF